MKKLLGLLIAITLMFSLAACNSNQDKNIQTEDLKEMIVGAEIPYLLYANSDYCIIDMWHGGIVAYDFATQKICDRITFEELENAGFSYPQPTVSEDGQTIYFREDSQKSEQPYTYSYNLETKELNKENDEMNNVIHHENIFENQQIQELLSDGLAYGTTMIILDDTFIVTRLKKGGSLLSNLEIVFVKEDLSTDKTFDLFEKQP